MKSKVLILLIICLAVGFANAQDQKKLNLTAKFLLKRLEPAKLDEAQMEKFYELSTKLKNDLVELRAKANISKELIRQRDEVYKDMKEDKKLKSVDYIDEMAKRLDLSPVQKKGFEDTIVVKKEYKDSVMQLLRPDQKAKMVKAKKKSG